MLLLTEDDVRAAIEGPEALRAVRDGFVALARGEAVSPPNFDLALPDRNGELHVKGGYLTGREHFAVKLATGFYDNPGRGLPASGGLSIALSSVTGEIVALVADRGLLTELRTAAAGALAADLLARERVERVAVVGAGGQARHQLRALLGVRTPQEVVVAARRADAGAAYAEEMTASLGVSVRAVTDVAEAVRGADVIVTTTPARSPVLRAEWVRAGAHVTAVGSDMPDKHELDPSLLARADKLIVDSLDAAARSGELHHALDAGLLTRADVHAELGAVAAGLRPGRTGHDEVTVCDLTGLGVQDVAITSLLVRRAASLGLGRRLDL